MSKFKIPKSIIPNTATCLNIFSGFLSIIFASKGEFHLAALFIFIATFFDLIDGLLARATKTASPFGVELDSLADVISFGLAPAFLIYQAHFIKYDFWGIVLSSSVLIFGALRLARFNVQVEDIKIKQDFNGLPIPISALTLASFVLFYYNGVNIVKPFNYFLLPSVVALSLLMVSKIRYNTLPKMKYLKLLTKFSVYATAIVLLVLVYLTNGEAFFYMIIFHILFGLLRHLYFVLFNNSKLKMANK
ncbi:MAG: CDP-diacylglycerol--serine O-phosphatidyltransferase [Bacteroidetes bacterium]|nr:CDP-diacylglycerol--serine O-phosphatidyltransferase [Bacteroidota bacterium]MBU1114495.1 CDP-diacylglycerol--serine O-phosphatidyltransferase [Bacteroidota bacterium]MBU1799905.1 CDP-diacylglycerol--serine O-phosphatidyltransferase [Bacteroidota bacterium]